MSSQAGRSVWTFLLPLGYQFAQLASRLQPALKSITGNISLLDRLASFVNSGTAQIAHPASLLDTDQLSSSLKFTLEHWSWFVPLDIAGGILIWLLWTLLSSDEEPAGADKKTDEAKTATSHDVRMKEVSPRVAPAYDFTEDRALMHAGITADRKDVCRLRSGQSVGCRVFLNDLLIDLSSPPQFPDFRVRRSFRIRRRYL